jgi:CheY-like chemotaxis protein
MSGWLVLEQLKSDSKLCDIPVAIYSTSSSKIEIDRALDLNASFYWVKPDKHSTIKNVLKIILNTTLSDLKNVISSNTSIKGIYFPSPS